MSLPIVVPAHVTAALRPGETALFNADTREWFAVDGGRQRSLGLSAEQGGARP